VLPKQVIRQLLISRGTEHTLGVFSTSAVSFPCGFSAGWYIKFVDLLQDLFPFLGMSNTIWAGWRPSPTSSSAGQPAAIKCSSLKKEYFISNVRLNCTCEYGTLANWIGTCLDGFHIFAMDLSFLSNDTNAHIKPPTVQRCRSETEKFILMDLFISVFSQSKKYHLSGNLKFNNLDIFRILKLRILMEKNPPNFS